MADNTPAAESGSPDITDTATLNAGDRIAIIIQMEDGPASITMRIDEFQTADPNVAYTVVGHI